MTDKEFIDKIKLQLRNNKHGYYNISDEKFELYIAPLIQHTITTVRKSCAEVFKKSKSIKFLTNGAIVIVSFDNLYEEILTGGGYDKKISLYDN